MSSGHTDLSVNQLSPVGIKVRFSSDSSLDEKLTLYFFIVLTGRGNMLSSSMSEVSTAANFRSGVRLFYACFPLIVDSILDKGLSRLGLSAICKDSMPTKVPRAKVGPVFITPVMLLMV